MVTQSQTSAGGKGLHIGLWVVQVLLAVAFGMAGGMKLTSSTDQLAKMAAGMSVGLIRFIGVAEMAGALGMILPAATRILPVLTAWAGVGLATIMVLAAALLISRGEFSNILPALVLLAMAVFVAWGRFVKAPISPRA
jgi:putative oxidoreductase